MTGSWREKELKNEKHEHSREFMQEIHPYMAAVSLKGQFAVFGVRLYEVIFVAQTLID